MALHAGNARAFEIGDPAVRSEHQHFMAEAFQLANCLCQRSHDAVDLGNERLGKEGDAHRLGPAVISRGCHKAYHAPVPQRLDWLARSGVSCGRALFAGGCLMRVLTGFGLLILLGGLSASAQTAPAPENSNTIHPGAMNTICESRLLPDDGKHAKGSSETTCVNVFIPGCPIDMHVRQGIGGGMIAVDDN